MTQIYQHLINGEWCTGEGEIANINPSNINETLGIASNANATMISEAIDSAHKAHNAWAQTNIEQRSDILQKIGNELIVRKEELGELLSKEEGKPRAEGIGEVERGGRFFHYYAAEALRQHGSFTDSVRTGIEIETIRSPLGVVLLITPWNFPSALPAWKIAPALAFGNCVLLKPSEQTPASAFALAEIITQSGVPAGVFQLILGDGKVGQMLVDSDGIDGVSFTGSMQTGSLIAQASAAKLRPFQLEMGSKNALVILDDADVEYAASCAVNGSFSGTGQKCTASSRIIVSEKIYPSFMAAFTRAASALKVGHALAKDTTIGPVVSAAQLNNNQHYLKSAQAEGAHIAFQGNLDGINDEGYYFAPVIFDQTNNQMNINRTEVFAPMTCVIKVADYDEALSVCNDTKYGLTTAIITQSLARATHFKRNAQSGTIMVNLPTSGTDYHVPFGGMKHSSYGPREQGQAAIEFYTKLKTAYVNAR